MEKLTIQEEEVMIYIWELQDCFVKDIVSKYPQPAPPYTTVASIVKNLERKGYVKSKHIGNTYQYTPAISTPTPKIAYPKAASVTCILNPKSIAPSGKVVEIA